MTTGPASIDPDTGKPYGLRFPVVNIKDFVNVQRALIESLGIKKLDAVVGASMGALQAYEWAASHPDMVGRIVAVIGTPGADPYLIGWLDIWAEPIRLDPKWNNGDYYDKEPPLAGLAAALKIITLHANHWEWAARARAAGRRRGKIRTRRWSTIQDRGHARGRRRGRAKTADANHFIYLARANQLASADSAE